MGRLLVRGAVTVGFGLPMTLLGLAQTLQYASLIDSPYVAATLLLPPDSLEGLYLAATVFLLGTMLVADAVGTRSGR